ncbi:MAG TPA: cytidylate kinase family protein [Candidatus Saccharimonadales bacterium]|jgi:cytidylate kinase|nr:cytidylate kinase family protein [Candidatus Saccharimonadales bacterium]
MEKKHIITLAGRPGSGKSSTAKTVAAQLGYHHFSSGDLFRALGKERGIDVLQANLSAEQNAEIDHLIDARLQKIGETQDNQVIDSRTAWHWIPNSFKVFLDLDLQVAAARILDGMDDARLASEHVHRDPVEYAGLLQKRLDSETRRYKALYDIDPYDTSNYDLVIDTATYSLGQVAQLVLEKYHAWLQE